MKKILIISNLYPSNKDPYYGTFVKNFVDDLELRKEMYNIDLCAIRGRSYNIYIKIYKYMIFYLNIMSRLLLFRYDLVYVHIITHAALPIRFISLFKKLPLVFNIHGEDLISQTRLAAFFLRIVTPLLMRAKLIVVPSYFFKRKVEVLLPQISSSKLYVSASGGVKPFFFDIMKTSISQPIPIIGYVSRIDRGKGWDTFLRAIKIVEGRHVRVRAQLVGRGEEVCKMNKLIDDLKLGNSVEYIGPVAYRDLPSVYVGFDLFVFPTRLEESLGLVGLEAMACHTPVVGSRIGGLTDYIEDGVNGFFFDPQDEKSLAESIIKYLSLSTMQQATIRQAAYSTALKYKSDVVSASLLDKVLL